MPEENFADKWPEKARKKQIFEKWATTLQEDINSLSVLKGIALHNAFKRMFGENAAKSAIEIFGNDFHEAVRSQKVAMSSTSCQWSASGDKPSKPHTFYGK